MDNAPAVAAQSPVLPGVAGPIPGPDAPSFARSGHVSPFNDNDPTDIGGPCGGVPFTPLSIPAAGAESTERPSGEPFPIELS